MVDYVFRRPHFYGAIRPLAVVLRPPTLAPIARWDVVPWQRIGATFKAGVVAFHKEGIARVEFSTTDGNGHTETETVESMTLNSRTGVWEYWTEITASVYDDGEITLTARVVANDGGSRTLDDIVLIADDGTTVPQCLAWVDTAGNDSTGVASPSETGSNPFLTIGKAALEIRDWMNANTAMGAVVDGGIIYLNVGTHNWRDGNNSADMNSTTEWLTLTAASGGTTSDTISTYAGNEETLNLMRLRVKDIGWSGYQRPGPASGELWFDGAVCIGPSTTHSSAQPVLEDDWVDGRYITGSSFDTYKEPTGYDSKLIRDTTFNTIGDTVLLNPEVVINVTISDVDPGVTGVHANVAAWSDVGPGSGDFNNFIVYGLKATDCHYSGMILHRNSAGYDDANIAFVNVDIELRDPIRGDAQSGGFTLLHKIGFDHELMWHVTLRYSDSTYTIYNYLIADAEESLPTVISNSSYIGNNFSRSDWDGDTDNVVFTDTEFDENHVVAGATGNDPFLAYDSNLSTGTADMDANGVPDATGNLTDELSVVLVPIDVNGNTRDATPDKGAYEYVAAGVTIPIFAHHYKMLAGV